MTVADPSSLEWIRYVWLPAATLVIGILISQWWLSKKDRKDLEQKNYENTTKLIEQHDGAYAEYVRAIAAYQDAPLADADSFVEIATKGDRYFYQLNLLSAAILSGKVDPCVRDEVLLPKVRAAAGRSLPQHYDALKTIAGRYGFPYAGELRRADYSAIYSVVDKYGAGPDWASIPD